MLRGRIERIRSDFDRLRAIPMGDPSEREVIVYLPPDFKSKGELPSVYFLPGWGSRASKFVHDSGIFGMSFLEQIENAILSQHVPAFIGVFVDAASKLGCSQYINSPSLGPIQDWIADDVTELVDSRFGAAAHAEKRVIAGHSSGGFGAIWMGLQRPDRFRGVISAAGDSFFELSVLSHLLPTWSELQKAGSIENFIKNFLAHPQPTSLGSRSFLTMLTLSLAPCYAPRPGQGPLHGELFFDFESGALKKEVWEEYLSKDPLQGFGQIDAAPLKKSFFLLDCGKHDEYAAQLGHRQLYQKLKNQNIPAQLEEFDGRHSGNDWRYSFRLKAVMNQMGLS